MMIDKEELERRVQKAHAAVKCRIWGLGDLIYTMHVLYDKSPVVLKSSAEIASQDAMQDWIAYQALQRELNEREKKYRAWHDMVNDPDILR